MINHVCFLYCSVYRMLNAKLSVHHTVQGTVFDPTKSLDQTDVDYVLESMPAAPSLQNVTGV